VGVCFYIWQDGSAASQPHAFSCSDVLPFSKLPRHPRPSPGYATRPHRTSPASLCPICAFPAAHSCSSCDTTFCHSHLYACPDCDIRLCAPCLDLHLLDGHWSDSDTASTLHPHRVFNPPSHAASPTRSPLRLHIQPAIHAARTPQRPLRLHIQPATHAARTPQRPLRLHIQPAIHAARKPRRPLRLYIQPAITVTATHPDVAPWITYSAMPAMEAAYHPGPVFQPTINPHPVPSFSNSPIHSIINFFRPSAASSHSSADQRINSASFTLPSPLRPAMSRSIAPNTIVSRSLRRRLRNHHPSRGRWPQLRRKLLSHIAGLFASLARASISCAAPCRAAISHAAVSHTAIFRAAISRASISRAAVSRAVSSALSREAVSRSSISPAEACA
jgi:hypothetical protein